MFRMPMVWVVLLSEMALVAAELATVMVAVLPAPEAAMPFSQLLAVAQSDDVVVSFVHVPSAAMVVVGDKLSQAIAPRRLATGSL
jgi:hypothetical protein